MPLLALFLTASAVRWGCSCCCPLVFLALVFSFVKIEWRFLYRRFQAVKPFLLYFCAKISIIFRLSNFFVLKIVINEKTSRFTSLPHSLSVVNNVCDVECGVVKNFVCN